MPTGPVRPGTTIAFLGCGTLGTAILCGILASLDEQQDLKTAITDTKFQNVNIPNQFIACVRRTESAKRIENAVKPFKTPVQVLQNNNVLAIRKADVIILGCKPYMVEGLLRRSDIKQELLGKLLISICAGLSVDQISSYLSDQPYKQYHSHQSNACKIVRVMPNTAAVIRESMSVIATNDPPLSQQDTDMVEWIFSQVGQTATLAANQMDASTALCGSGPAFCALIMEALADGALAMGIPRVEAQMMAAQTMKGAAGLVLNGEHPANVREKVSTPGGTTIGGLLVLEEGCVRGTVARAVREAATVATLMGKGVPGVNGTRR